ncbi:hypothetical protein OKA05_27025 [Luteolibacter arcticus]|uniref:Uncharacterized protein n=1 Tax=Luteolibacter arcticus TaxID=1581411 RepID=A0ABT3GRY2_9BACT|nr:hypothetical protein [Luteolibacter arcticus]MCW1926240.1 hypothetical protein [Luteolibacter arcticus]
MPCNRTYICTDCRTARRARVASGLQTNLRCRSCRGALWELGREWRIPTSGDVKAWDELAAEVARSRPVREALIRRSRERLLREIDRKIEITSLRKSSARREELLQVLSRKRRRVEQEYSMGEAVPAHDPSPGKQPLRK